jgi:regulator of protease activity HflC (stomatin/prohibitin superfamily)
MNDVLDFLCSYWPLLVAVTFILIYLLLGITIVDQWERYPIKRFGKLVKVLGPGLTWVEPFSSRIIKRVSLQAIVANVYGRLDYQKLPTLQTHDNVPVSFQVFLTYKVMESQVRSYVLNVEDAEDALFKRTLAIISECVSATPLDSILHDRIGLYQKILQMLSAAVQDWGINVIAVEMTDVSITDEAIREALALKPRAEKEADAELARAQMQKRIAEELKAAADTYDENAWRLKGLEVLQEMTRSGDNNTVIFASDLIPGGLAKLLGK